MNDKQLYNLAVALRENCADSICNECKFQLHTGECTLWLLFGALADRPDKWDLSYIKELIEK